jgi:pimeloyl-ACP methyl ester carboxylesterase
VLVLAAVDDFLVPVHAALPLAEGLVNGRLMLQSRGGHACNVVEPEEFHERVLPWLAGENLIEE